MSPQIIAPTLTSLLSFILKTPTPYSPSAFECLQAIPNLVRPPRGSAPAAHPSCQVFSASLSTTTLCVGIKQKARNRLNVSLFLVHLSQFISKCCLL